jgi:hypothetical protein
MRNVFLGISTLAVAGVLAAGALSAKADSENAAAVINQGEGVCNMLGSDADGNSFVDFGTGLVVHQVENNGKSEIKCSGDDVTNDSGRAQSYRGFVCGILLIEGGAVFTEDSHATVAPNGNATLTCTYDLAE